MLGTCEQKDLELKSGKCKFCQEELGIKSFHHREYCSEDCKRKWRSQRAKLKAQKAKEEWRAFTRGVEVT